MTCREFKHTAASLTLWELSRPCDEQVLDHAEECPKCGAWLDRQQMLAATMQTLQARTDGREAGPHVERALLRMFRQVPFEATQPVVARRSAPIAWRLSRLFEVGAYIAVAAAIVVGLFLGVRLMEQRSVTVSVQSPPAPAAPAQQQTTAAANAYAERNCIGPRAAHYVGEARPCCAPSLPKQRNEAAKFSRGVAEQRRPGVCLLDVLRSAELFE